MSRKYVDCAAPGCTLRFSAADEKELETAVVDHAVARHQAKDTQDFRERVRHAMRDA